jgi:hypothetical protein
MPAKQYNLTLTIPFWRSLAADPALTLDQAREWIAIAADTLDQDGPPVSARYRPLHETYRALTPAEQRIALPYYVALQDVQAALLRTTHELMDSLRLRQQAITQRNAARDRVKELERAIVWYSGTTTDDVLADYQVSLEARHATT